MSATIPGFSCAGDRARVSHVLGNCSTNGAMSLGPGADGVRLVFQFNGSSVGKGNSLVLY